MRITLLILCLLANSILFAQKYTYFQVQFGYSSTGLNMPENTPQIYNQWYAGGGTYEFHLRQEISSIISMELGYAYRSYFQSFGLRKDQFQSMGQFNTHQIPLKGNLDVYLYKDVISVYASFGYMFNIEVSPSVSNVITSFHQEDFVKTEWVLLPKSKYRSTFLINTGARIRLIEELQFEVELGRAFGFKDVRIYNLTYLDNSNSLKTFTVNDRCNYWYFKFGLSYPIQRVGEMAGYAISKLL